MRNSTHIPESGGLTLQLRPGGFSCRAVRGLRLAFIVLGALMAHGVERLRLGRRLSAAQRVRSRDRRICRTLESLGPVYVKAGQMLAARPDLLPPSLAGTLSRLHDRVRPFPSAVARALVEAELRLPISAVFRHFEDQPRAAGSIAQVHRAELLDGRVVAVKIQRPNLEANLAADLALIRRLARWAERLSPMLARQRLSAWVGAAARLLDEECDFVREAGQQQRFEDLFADDPNVRVPHVHTCFSTARILVMDYMDGIPIDRIARLRCAGIDPVQVARRGADCVMRQIFEHGILHCDPHPGNLLVLPDGAIGLIDFGQVARLTRADQNDLGDLLTHLVRRDAAGLTAVLGRMTDADATPDWREVERDLSGLLDRHLYRPLGELSIGRLFMDLLQLLVRHGLRLRPCWFPIVKEISAIDQVGKVLDPRFDMIQYAAPHIRDFHVRRWLPSGLAKKLLPLCRGWVGDMAELVFRGLAAATAH